MSLLKKIIVLYKAFKYVRKSEKEAQTIIREKGIEEFIRYKKARNYM